MAKVWRIECVDRPLSSSTAWSRPTTACWMARTPRRLPRSLWKNAEILRWGSIHRNAYVNAPAALAPHLALRDSPTTLLAGQLTGVEGYTESAATGLLAGINLDRLLRGDDPALPPTTTMLGALYRYLRDADPTQFQPMNANFGLLDDLAEPVRDKRRKRELLADRALAHLERWRDDILQPLGAVR